MLGMVITRYHVLEYASLNKDYRRGSRPECENLTLTVLEANFAGLIKTVAIPFSEILVPVFNRDLFTNLDVLVATSNTIHNPETPVLVSRASGSQS